MNALLELSDLATGYGGTPVVRGVSLAVEEGELVALIGPNGAGKTTLLRAISGQLALARGQVHFCGRRADGLRPDQLSALGLCHVSEGRVLFGDLTVEEHLQLASEAVAPWPSSSRAAARLERFPWVKQRRCQKARTLSGGEQRILALLCGLMREPRLFLLDEPSLGLAPGAAEGLSELLAELPQEGKAVLLVEQNLALVQRLAQRAYVMAGGRIIAHNGVEALAGNATLTKACLGL